MSAPMSFAILATLGGAAGWLFFIRRYDRAEPEPIRELFRVGILGGAMSSLCAMIFNDVFSIFTHIAIHGPFHVMPSLFLAIFVGLNEEFWKLNATRMLIWKNPNFNEPIDGMVYSLTVALGFATFENLLYLSRFGLTTLSRSLITTPAHLGFASIWGLGFVYARYRGRADNAFPALLPFWLLAAAGHAMYDFLAFTGSAAVLVSFALMVALMVWAVRRLKRLEKDSPFLAPGECSVCRFKNSPEARFCARCGEGMEHEFARICPSCASYLPMQAKYCGTCGFSLQEECVTNAGSGQL